MYNPLQSLNTKIGIDNKDLESVLNFIEKITEWNNPDVRLLPEESKKHLHKILD